MGVIKQSEIDEIDRLTRRAVETYGQMVEVWMLEGGGTGFYIAQAEYKKDLRLLGEALNQVVGRPKELVMRELRGQLERWEESKCKI